MKMTINRPGLHFSGLLLVVGLLLSGLKTAGEARAFAPPTGTQRLPNHLSVGFHWRSTQPTVYCQA